jgi:hypothetical protein
MHTQVDPGWAEEQHVGCRPSPPEEHRLNRLSNLVLILALVLAAAGACAQDKDTCRNPKWLQLPTEELQRRLQAHKDWVKRDGQELWNRGVFSDAYAPGRADFFCNLDLRGANLQGADLRGANLQGANLFKANLHKADLGAANLQGAILNGANLQGANLFQAKLQEAYLLLAELQEATLVEAKLLKADLSYAFLQGADLSEANLQGANLVRANLWGAKLVRADLTNTRLTNVYVPDAIYAPQSSLPNEDVAGIQGIESVIVPSSSDVVGLVRLRKLLQEAGLPEERDATYAIERNKTRQLIFREVQRGEGDKTKWAWVGPRWEKPLSLAEGSFRWLAFELPVSYGLYPGRALLVLFASFGLFAFVYFVALVTETGSIYRVWPAGRLDPLLGAELAKEAKAERLLLWRSWRAFPWSLWFSMLSAFHLGFRELNIGNWLARVQAREYGVQAVGWVRVVAGLQSLLSVYLLAMWVLTYFGRPFG